MRRLRPHNRLAIASGDEEKPLTDGRRTVVTSPKLIPFDTIAIAFERMDEAPERLPFALRVGAISDQRSPRRELFHILEDDDARPNELCPTNRHPCKPANCFLNGLAAFGFREMLAVW